MVPKWPEKLPLVSSPDSFDVFKSSNIKHPEPPLKTVPPKGTGAIYFFTLVLRVKNPLRIWLLPDSKRATGSPLTRDDSEGNLEYFRAPR